MGLQSTNVLGKGIGLQYGEVSKIPEHWYLADFLASSNTGLAAIQLAKLIGLRVIAVADLTRHAKRLVDLGVDVQVDRNDPLRAIAIIANTTDHGLRFGLDTVGKETAGYRKRNPLGSNITLFRSGSSIACRQSESRPWSG